MKNRLISMTAFVIDKNEIKKRYRYKSKQTAERILNYANFLKQPLAIGMFVPVNDDGEVLEEPLRIHFNTDFDYKAELYEYNEAKNRCLFEGFTLKDGSKSIVVNLHTTWNVELFNPSNYDFKTIEDLVSRSPFLTQTALKQLGL